MTVMNLRYLPFAGAVVLLVAGLTGDAAVSGTIDTSGTAALSDYEIAPATPGRPAAILYYCLDKRIVLSDDEVSQILARVEQAHPRHPKVWFLMVHTSPLSETTLFPEFEVFITTYFEPTLQATQVRRGRALDLKLRGASRSQYEIEVRDQYEYAQLANPAGSSGRVVAVPSPRFLPFRAPARLGDADLVGIDECVREAARTMGSRRLAEDGPLSIVASKGGNFDAYLGHGSGVEVTCKRSGDGYSQIGGIRYWMAP